MTKEDGCGEQDVLDMQFGLARMVAKLMVALVRRGAIAEQDVAEILVGEERIIAALRHDGDLRSALELSFLHDAVASELAGCLELKPYVERLHRLHGRASDEKSPRQLLDMTPEEMEEELRKHRKR